MSVPAPTRSGASAAPSLPRLLVGLAGGGRSAGLDAHLERYGAHGASHVRADLIGLLEESGLTGRGGAAFPVAVKMAAVASRSGRRVVVVNGAEGEPASGKDRALLRRLPHLVIDGAVLAASAVGAREVIVATGSGGQVEQAALAHAIGEREGRRLDGPVRTFAVAVPNSFVAGEETALVRFLNGGPAKPTFTPPRPFERGVGGAPTLVQNAETLANVALIARFGAGWFRSLGTEDEPGSVLVSLTGAVGRAGVYEVELGTTFEALLRQAEGATGPLQALLVGGFFGSWLEARTALSLRLLDADLAPYGAALGARAVVALPEGACGVVETARVAGYLARESAGQCGPCVHGLAAVARALGRLARRERDDRRGDLLRWLDLVRGRGACRHPDGAARFVASALDVFADEFSLHARGRCSGAGRLVLPVPKRQEAAA